MKNEKIYKAYERSILKESMIDSSDPDVALNALHNKAKDLLDSIKFIEKKLKLKELKKSEDLMRDVLQSIIIVTNKRGE